MVRIGEETGKLDDVLDALSVYYDREASIAQTIKNAVTYPLVMIFMMLLVILVLITRVMPIFNQIFQQLGTEMTGLSKALLDFGTTINYYSTILIILTILVVAAVFYFGRTKKGRRNLRTLAAHTPMTRAFMEKIAMCRFASGMSLTLSSGMSPEECLRMAAELIDHDSFAARLEVCRESLDEGQEFHKALLDAEVFSGIYARMASIGDRTGALDEVMQEIADQCQEEIDLKFTSLIAALEPTLVIVLSLIVGLILLSVMLPLMGIMSSI